MDPTLYPAFATITAAFVAGGIAYLSSVLSKEQKTSEFRYAWLNAVLDDIAKFTGATESITTSAWSISKTEGAKKAQVFVGSAEPRIGEALAAYYRARIRLYPKEHARVLDALDALRSVLLEGGLRDHSKTDPLIRETVQASHDALKAEWARVKRGETIFVVTKWVSLIVFSLPLLVGIGFAVSRFFH